MATRRPPISRNLRFKATVEQKINSDMRRRATQDLRWLFDDDHLGFWYDPSDTRTTLQNTSGTSADADSDVVGLLLDKSRCDPYDPGTHNLIRNGDFSSGSLSPWTQSAGVADEFTVVNGRAEITSATTYVGLKQDFAAALDANKVYLIEFDHGGYINAVRFGASTSGGAITPLYPITNDSRHAKYIAMPQGGTTSLLIQVITGQSTWIDNVSVREIPGIHQIQTTTASKPTVNTDSNGKRYLQFDAVDDYMRSEATFLYDESLKPLLVWALRYDLGTISDYRGAMRIMDPAGLYTETAGTNVRLEVYGGQGSLMSKRYALVRRSDGSQAFFNDDNMCGVGGASEIPQVRWADFQAEEVGCNKIDDGGARVRPFDLPAENISHTCDVVFGAGYGGASMGGRIYGLVYAQRPCGPGERPLVIYHMAEKMGYPSYADEDGY